AEKGSGRIRCIQGNGTLVTLAGTGTGTDDNDALLVNLSEPKVLVLEPDGNLLVSENHGARVRRLYLQYGL
ncbi:MAG: hypothetical protein KGR26_09030, partial [Cyanobacteria bacterium REEB65]|nr:hypothetical protein [Cyanobacteria bacterium REEB65]